MGLLALEGDAAGLAATVAELASLRTQPVAAVTEPLAAEGNGHSAGAPVATAVPPADRGDRETA